MLQAALGKDCYNFAERRFIAEIANFPVYIQCDNAQIADRGRSLRAAGRVFHASLNGGNGLFAPILLRGCSMG
jgi:hypothetical protein